MGTRESCKWLSNSRGDGGPLLLARRALIAAPFSLLAAAKPEIGNFDFSLLDEGPVPPELFFVREHFPRPQVSAAGWKLSIAGAVKTPLELPLEKIAAEGRVTLPVTIECAENPVGGGLVSHAEWTGARMGALLARAAPTAEARFARLTGADGFARSIPLSKAIHPATLLVHQMNGEKLTANHGFPLRALIPGWYGMDSVKWLRRIELLPQDDSSDAYVRETRSLLLGRQPAGRVTAMQVKSAFSRPLDGAILTKRHFIVRGAAWAGEHRVRAVEVSTDGAKSWTAASLARQTAPYAWVHWSYEWKIPGPGQYELAVRGEDEVGRSQPARHPPDRVDAYELNACQTVQVTVA
jgi:DMSO/TMAO reductase YedYZ molybdopterin-dependent catalytic subunit